MQYDTKSVQLAKAKHSYMQLLMQHTVVLAIGNRLTLAAMAQVPIIERGSLGNFTTASEAYRAVISKKPSLLMVSEFLEQGSAMDLISKVKHECPDTKCLLFLERETQPIVRDAINAHADGVCFISTIGNGNDGDFIRAMAAIADGTTYYPQEVRFAAGFDLKPLPDLSVKEYDVLRCLCDGMSNKEIAQHLVLSTETIKTHLSNLISKFGSKDRTGVVIAAIRAGV